MDEQEQEVELKPCPFCGSENVEVMEPDEYTGSPCCWIVCHNCDMETGEYFQPEHVIEKWNRRPED